MGAVQGVAKGGKIKLLPKNIVMASTVLIGVGTVNSVFAIAVGVLYATSD